MDLLPEDLLADVLRRLPPRGLAVSRGVCRDWRAAVDARCDLRTDLLPTKLGGIFVTTDGADLPEFFVRPSMACRVAGRLEHYEGLKYRVLVQDSCNGLILLENYDQVVNPATRQQARLPPYPASLGSDYYFKYLAFDPALSPHYEVLAMQDPFDLKGKLLPEWPPSVCMMGVYSSSTTKWEERPFIREEGSATTVAYYVGSGRWHAVYLNRALYTYWNGDFIIRISFSNNKYKVINLPTYVNGSKEYRIHLGKSKNKIHFATVDSLRLQVWFLNESGGKTEWILKHDLNMRRLYFPKYDQETNRPWISEKGKYDHKISKEPAVENDSDWNSDEDDALEIDDMGGKFFRGFIDVFGFHPYKEIIFLYLSHSRVVAYYFNASKIQDLGVFRIGHRYHDIEEAFIYTLLE